MMLISSEQIRAARALLRWGQSDLATMSGVSIPAIANIETEKQQPNLATQQKLLKAFVASGVEFIDGGVRRTRSMVQVFEGEHAHKSLLDDIYEELCLTKTREVCISGLKELNIEERQKYTAQYDYLQKHLKRLDELGVKERILTLHSDFVPVAPKEWYRVLPEKYFSPYSFHIYGEKIAMGTWGPPPQVIVIKSKHFSESLKGLFDFAWDHAESI